MDRCIFKYVLNITGVQSVTMPEKSRILHYDNQFEKPTIWVEVNPSNASCLRHLLIVGTGHIIPINNTILVYIGTALFNNRAFVWHLYEVVEENRGSI